MKLKDILKSLKLNESTISMLLGAVVILVVGVLVINYFNKGGENTNIPGSATETTPSPTAQKGSTHTVVRGESLWTIAEDAYGSGYNWIDIASVNDLTDPGNIETGQKLEIPVVESKTRTLSTKQAISIEEDRYTVVKGDSLWDIAVRAYGDGYNWVEIAAVNNLDNPNLIHTGNTLTIPR